MTLPSHVAVVAIADKASQAIMEIYQTPEYWSTQYKLDNSPITKADNQAHEVIVKGLRRLTPDTPVLSEEGDHPTYSTRQKWTEYWLIDPLDGTKEFLQKNDSFTVNIALLKGSGELLMGIVVVPATTEAFWAVKGGGSWYRDKNGSVQSIKCNKFKWTDKNLRVCASRNHSNRLTTNFISQLQDPSIIVTGSSLKFALIARGEADVYPRLGPTCEWDTAAAQIVLEEAGGRVVQLTEDGRISAQPIQYNKRNLINPFFLALGDCSDFPVACNEP